MGKPRKKNRRAGTGRPRDKSRKQAVALATGPTDWDMGAMGPANRIGLTVEPAPDWDEEQGKYVNPNGKKRARRVDMLEHWHGEGCLTTAAYNAGFALRAAFEKTQEGRAMDYSQPVVDSSPKPDHAVTIQIDRMSGYHAIARLIPADDMPIIEHCVLHGASPSSLHIKGRRPYLPTGPSPNEYDRGVRDLAEALDRLAILMERARVRA